MSFIITVWSTAQIFVEETSDKCRTKLWQSLNIVRQLKL